MRERPRVGLWWVPLLLALTPLVGLAPAHRDLLDFFAPMRSMTAAALAEGTIPWLNLANGCGEAWFANPETAVLYPPAWVHLMLPPAWALSLEIALHLAWLSLGVGLLARHLGAGAQGRLVAEAAAWAAGPVVFTVGVLNNLETLAWVPWMVLAARRRDGAALPLVALATALAWLGGEPQIWALAVALTVASAHRRAQAVAGVAVGTLLVAVQMVPFAFWVLEGDRGPQAAAWVLRGALAPSDWTGLLVPALGRGPERMVYLESLFVGAPLLLCAMLGARRRWWLLVAAGSLIVLGTLPALGGGELLLALTGGLLRYPSRFALLGVALLLPAMGRGADDWLAGGGSRLAAVVGGLTILLCVPGGPPARWWLAAAPAAVLLAAAARPKWRPLRGAALAAGLVGAAAAALPLLGLGPASAVAADADTWPEAERGGRLYVPAPAAESVRWLAGGAERRRLWPVGYLNLVDGLDVVRTDAPVANQRLAAHLEAADRGPDNRWWLDALAARWVVLTAAAPIPTGMETVRLRDGMRLLRNDRAYEVISVVADLPRVDIRPHPAGRLGSLRLEGNRCEAVVDADGPGWLWISLAPVRGWTWRIDGTAVEVRRGPGILQAVPVAAGTHRLAGAYRPPFLPGASLLSGLGALIVVLAWRRSRRAGALESTHR